jgi:hypothetical protein
MYLCRILYQFVAIVALNRNVATVLDHIVAFDAIIKRFIALVTSSPATWRTEHAWHFSVLQSSGVTIQH